MTDRYPVAQNGVFHTIQGEGLMLGVPMVFVRLGGCSIGCPGCDTDYRVAERLKATEIGERVADVRGAAEWVWVTGGEPADHDLLPLLTELRHLGRIALATSGQKPLGAAARHVEFLSVSPHGAPSSLALKRANQINLVPGLNGLRLDDWRDFDPWPATGYVTPNSADPATVKECVEFVSERPRWRLGVQAHKMWGLP